MMVPVSYAVSSTSLGDKRDAFEALYLGDRFRECDSKCMKC